MTEHYRRMAPFAQGCLNGAREDAGRALNGLHTAIIENEASGLDRHEHALSATMQLVADMFAETILLFHRQYPQMDFNAVWSLLQSDVEARTLTALRIRLREQLGLQP